MPTAQSSSYYHKLLLSLALSEDNYQEASKQLDKVSLLSPNGSYSEFYQKASAHLKNKNLLAARFYIFLADRKIKQNDSVDKRIISQQIKIKDLFNRIANNSHYKVDKEDAIEIDNSYKYFDISFHKSLLNIESLKNGQYTDEAAIAVFRLKNYISDSYVSLTERQRRYLYDKFEPIVNHVYNASFNPDLSTDIDICYDAALMSKSLLLSYSTEIKRIIFSGNKTSLKNKYYEYMNLKNSLESSSVHNSDSLNIMIRDVERYLLKECGSKIRMPKNLNVNWRDIRNSLSEKEVAIEFIYYEDLGGSGNYVALILKNDWEHPRYVKLFSSSELKEVKNVPNASNYSNELDLKLSKLVWSKIIPYLDEKDTIFFAATQQLHHIPIESLPMDADNYIFTKYRIFRVSSTAELTNRQKIYIPKEVVLYGGLNFGNAPDSIDENSFFKRDNWDNLPSTIDEINYIDELLSEQNISVSKYYGSKGTEESFNSLSGSKIGMLHIASHGFVLNDKSIETLNDNLKKCGIILSGANQHWKNYNEYETNPNDGILTGEEISRLDFRGIEFVVLSACKTGLGGLNREGVYGLQRAFKLSGVNTIIMSLWSVDDKATELFMKAFYRNLILRNSKNEALNMTKKEVMSVEGFESPFYWAGFIMLD